MSTAPFSRLSPLPMEPSKSDTPPDRALMVREPYISFILSNKKRWELRGSHTKIRGRIGLIRSGSGLVIGECKIVDCLGPLAFEALAESRELSTYELEEIRLDGRPPYIHRDNPASKTYAWVLESPVLYLKPIRYRHPSGAITFVDLSRPGVLECSEASQSQLARQPQLF